MGGCFIQRYVGTKAVAGEPVPIHALGCISSPFCLVKAIERSSANPILDSGLTKVMIKTFMEHLHEPLFLEMLKDMGIDPDAVLASKNVHDYNSRYSTILGGYKDVKEYYEACSSKDVIKHIDIPTLSINSTDDPIIP